MVKFESSVAREFTLSLLLATVAVVLMGLPTIALRAVRPVINSAWYISRLMLGRQLRAPRIPAATVSSYLANAASSASVSRDGAVGVGGADWIIEAIVVKLPMSAAFTVGVSGMLVRTACLQRCLR